MAFGTWSEIGMVVFLALMVVVTTKIGAIGSAIGGRFARKK